MHKHRHPSDSIEQQFAEQEILSLLNEKSNLNLVGENLVLDNATFQIDGYSESPPILCEIYSHIGKMKVAQQNKIGKDILKMILIEKMKGKTFRKIIAFADKEAASSFSGGESWHSQIKNYFDVEIIVVEISQTLRKCLIKAQKRQYR